MEELFPRRVLLPDARGVQRYLRVTWHRETSTLVFSHWQGSICEASTPVSLQDAAQLVTLIVGSLKEAALGAASGGTPPPSEQPRGLLGRLQDRLRPQMAQVMAFHEQIRDEWSAKKSKSSGS